MVSEFLRYLEMPGSPNCLGTLILQQTRSLPITATGARATSTSRAISTAPAGSGRRSHQTSAGRWYDHDGGRPSGLRMGRATPTWRSRLPCRTGPLPTPDGGASAAAVSGRRTSPPRVPRSCTQRRRIRHDRHDRAAASIRAVIGPFPAGDSRQLVRPPGRYPDPGRAVSGQRSAVSGQRSAVSGQRSAVSGQRSAISQTGEKTRAGTTVRRGKMGTPLWLTADR